MPLAKAKLMPLDGGTLIEFMFNPTELTFTGSVKYNENQGAQAEKTGKSKVSYSNVNPYTVTISNILFDTYEDGIDVVKAHIEKFRNAIVFVPAKKTNPHVSLYMGRARVPAALRSGKPYLQADNVFGRWYASTCRDR